MPRRHPDRRRRRPGRRPPNRLGLPYRDGFTGHGLGTYYQRVFPGLSGAGKRHFFNKACLGVLSGFGLWCAGLGLILAGPLGALASLAAALVACGTYFERGRYFRA